jgi:EAL domain-containing protein (putative c-di-GMP-specific phosphodiesterase class I)
VRWRLPNGDLISPTEFIPVAERLGLISDIGEYVMRTACTTFRAWDFQGIAPPRIAINVSSFEIIRTDLFSRVERILQETGLRPMHLELEITEGSLLGAQGVGMNTLVRLRNMGVRIAVDDFGTGYSSLNYLQRLPIDVIKIDQSFVRELVSNPDSASIVQAILQVADRLDKSVVVEGIETTQERALLASWGCTTGQGYLWSRPLNAPDFEAFCRAQQTETEDAGPSRLV